MNYKIVNVLDTEATCYPDGKFPKGEKREIIEFGLTMVDLRTRSIIKTISIPVIPTRSRVHPFCTELTGWSYSKLKRQGVSFTEACRRLAKYGAQNRMLITDSCDELNLVRSQCRKTGIICPFGKHQHNVSTMLALLTGQNQSLSLSDKCRLLGFEPEGRLHRADADSRNIARVFLEVLNRASFSVA